MRTRSVKTHQKISKLPKNLAINFVFKTNSYFVCDFIFCIYVCGCMFVFFIYVYFHPWVFNLLGFRYFLKKIFDFYKFFTINIFVFCKCYQRILTTILIKLFVRTVSKCSNDFISQYHNIYITKFLSVFRKKCAVNSQ